MQRIFTLLVAFVMSVAVLGTASSADACPKCGKVTCCEPTCSYNPCIKYVEACRYRKCCECGPKVQTVLQVKDPCTCCIVEVPVCIPACCTGEPCVDSKCGLLGNGKVFYRWCCGFEVKVVLTKCGDITVVYLGHL